MVKVVIFDFDLTLFDSSEIKHFMDERQWSMVYKNINRCSIYPNVRNILNELKNKNIYIALVTNAPSLYIKKVLNFFDLNFDFIVCYHDVNKHKPNPEGINKVLEYFSIDNTETFYVGNDDIDYKTAYNANINFFGVPWGTFSQEVRIIHYEKFIDIIKTTKIIAIFQNNTFAHKS